MLALKCLLYTVLIYQGHCQIYGKQLKVINEWRYLDFAFPTNQDRELARENGRYVVGNSVPLDVDVDYRENGNSRIFVTIPRFQTGVPVTLGVLASQQAGGGRLVEPYPSYSWQSNPETNCDGIVSVFRIAIDECKRLWILDTGRIGDTYYCSPKLLAFDLKTDQLIHRYDIPEKDRVCQTSLLITPVVDVRDAPPKGQCLKTMIYMADVTGFGIIVYDMQKGKSWRAQNKYMFPTPDLSTYDINGDKFELMDGILTLALSPSRVSHGGLSNYVSGSNYISDKTMYFHTLASKSEVSVPLFVIDNETLWDEDKNSAPEKFVKLGNRGDHSAAQAMDQNGNLFFGLLNTVGIACWDSSQPYISSNIKVISQNRDTQQFPTGMKVIKNKKGTEELWTVTNRLQKLMSGTMSTSETNFRIMAISISELIGGKSCRSFAPPTSSNLYYPKLLPDL